MNLLCTLKNQFKVSTLSFGLIFQMVRWQKEVAVEFVNWEGLTSFWGCSEALLGY